MRKLLLGLLIWSGLATAQIGNFPPLVGQRGTTTPTNCAIGQLFFDTDATAGSNIYGCTAANTWTLQGGSGTVTGTGASPQVAYWSGTSALTGSANLTFVPTAGSVALTVGTGGTTSKGLIIGYGLTSGVASIWPTDVTPTTSNYALSFADGGGGNLTTVNGISGLRLSINNLVRASISSTVGNGIAIDAGVTASNAGRALSISQTWTDGTTGNIGIVGNFDMGATGTATGKLLSLQAGAAGTTEVLSVDYQGSIISGANISAGATGIISFAGTPKVGLASPGFVAAAGGAYAASDAVIGFSSTTAYSGTPDGSISRISAGVLGVGTGAAAAVDGTVAATNYRIAAKPVILGATPTYASGGCLTGAGTVVTNSNGTAYITVTNGTGCSASQPIVLTLPAATTGWMCVARNVSNGATSAPAQTGAVSTTSVTITNFSRTLGTAAAWTDSDVVVISCMGG